MAARYERWTAAIAIAIIGVALVAALRWTGAHPLPLWFDEANYANQTFEDRAAVLRGGPIAGVKALLFNDPARPPAYRAFVLPFSAVRQPNLTFLRGLAIAVTLLAMAILYVTTRSLLATAMVFAMPAVLSAGAWFGTEFPLFLAVALLMLALVPRVRPILLVMAVALGLLAKATFLAIAGPVILVALFFDDRPRVFVASAAGAAIAAGWWGWHLLPVLQFAQSARAVARASIVGSLAQRAATKVHIFAVYATGPVILIVILILLGVLVVRRGAADRRTLAIALAGWLPLLIVAAASKGFGPRIFAPALLPLSIIFALALATVSPRARLVTGLLVLAQTIFIAITLEPALPRVSQTDWRILRAQVPKPEPRIAVMGGWPSLTPPEIRYAWTRDGVDATVETLWRFENGAIDWTKVMQHALASDLVLVVPPGRPLPQDSASSGVFPIDNRYNAELITRLERSGKFERVEIGKADLLAYRRRRQLG